jgi:hypothetical protein
MDADEVYGAVARAMKRESEGQLGLERQLTELQARFDMLVQILTAQGALVGGHARLLERVGARASEAIEPKVRLRQFVDKHQVQSSDVDCAALFPLCHARCCSFSFDLTTQDIDDGIKWEIEKPYAILHERDHFCTHLDRGNGGCTVYDKRPATCRGYDCRNDPRIWADYDKRIPAPMGALQPPKK